MEDKSTIISRLKTFKRFVSKGWDTSMNFYVVDIDNFREQVANCCDSLIEAVEKDAPHEQLKQIMLPYIDYLHSLNVSETEEREYIAVTFYEISQIVSLDLAFRLDSVIYGRMLTLITNTISFIHKLVKNKPQEDNILWGIEVECKLGNHTVIEHTGGRESESEDCDHTYYGIAACKICGNFILLSAKNQNNLYSPNKYIFIVEKFPEDFTLEKAQQRMSQILHWRYKN